MIDGVVIKEVVSNEDDRGFFREIFKIGNSLSGLTISQVSHSLVKEKIIKGWHGHKNQHQWNYILQGVANIILYDDRIESPTYKNKQKFTVNGEIDKMYYAFPPGVLHGYKCVQGPMHIIYATSGLYDISDEIKESLTYENLDALLTS